MTVRWCLWALAPLAVVSAQEIPKAIRVAEPPASADVAGPDRVVSSTQQFVITGGEGADRAMVAMIAEEAKGEFQQLSVEAADTKALSGIGTIPSTKPADKEPKKTPVSIVLHGKPGDVPPKRTIATSIEVSDAGYRVRMDVHLCFGIEKDRLIHAVTSVMVLTRSLDNRSLSAPDVPFLVPTWLVEGLREAADWQAGRGDRRPYEALFKSGGMFKPEQLFGADEQQVSDMDAATRLAFRVSSGSMVMALLQQPQGKEGFRSFLTEVAPFQGEMPALLRKHFPGLNLSATSMEKWWALQMATLGGQKLATDVLTVTETEAALADALKLDFKNADGTVDRKDLSAWPEVAALAPAARVTAVALAREELSRLSFRCFPSYRPMLAEYETVLVSISTDKTKDVAARINDLAQRRTIMTTKVQRARDYLDWFEITRARETSGAFDDYMKLKDRLKANPHERTDNLSKYLDRMDALFGRASSPQQPVAGPPPLQPTSAGDFLPELPPLPK